MASLPWITVNQRLQKGILLINKLNNKKFELLLNHIVNAKTDDIFTNIELKQLQDSLKLNENDLDLLLQSISYIFKQSSKVVLKPTELQKNLRESIGIEELKAEVFVKEWSNEAKKDLGEFENQYNLDNVSWEVNLQTASSCNNKQAVPNSRIELDLSKVNSNEKQNVILDMAEDELHHLYNTLEVIQHRLDNISKNKQ